MYKADLYYQAKPWHREAREAHIKSTWVKPDILELCRSMSRGQVAGERLIMAEWLGLIGSEPLNWGQLLWGQNDDQLNSAFLSPSLFISLSRGSFHSFSSLCCPSRQWLFNYWWHVELILLISPAADLFVFLGLCCLLQLWLHCICVCVRAYARI